MWNSVSELSPFPKYQLMFFLMTRNVYLFRSSQELQQLKASLVTGTGFNPVFSGTFLRYFQANAGIVSYTRPRLSPTKYTAMMIMLPFHPTLPCFFSGKDN
jgi:hypothetical protein